MAKETDIVIRDRASSVLEKIINRMGNLIDKSEQLNQAVIKTDSSLDNLNGDSLNNIPPAIEEATQQQEEFNEEVERSNLLMDNLAKIALAIGIGKIAKESLGWAIAQSDQFATTNARIDLMNDGLRTTAEVQQMIFQAAQNARGEYQGMADMVGQLGILAKDAFNSTAETVKFAELINKQYTIAGTSAEGARAATLQLTQALASGVLRGEELNSIFEQAPTIIQSIADYLGVPIGQIREMASEGQITADIIKNAMFASADDINAKFEAMPKTWANHFTSLQNHIQRAFLPLFEQLSALANSKAVQEIMSYIINGIYVVANAITRVIALLGNLANWIVDVFGGIGPIIWGIVTPLSIIGGLLALYYAKLLAVSVATKVVAAAQWLWNSAVAVYKVLMGSALAMTILGIGMVVGAIYLGVAAFNYFAGTAVSATGIIFGALAWLGAGIVNIIKGIINIFIVFAQLLVNAFQLAVVGIAYTIATLITIVLFIIDSIVQIFRVGAILVVTIWNLGVQAVALILYGLITLVLAIFDAILNATYWVVEVFVNAWNSGVYGVQMAFYNMATGIERVMNAVAQGAVGVINVALGLISDLVNFAIQGLNKMIEGANNIPGVNISTIGEVDFAINDSSIGNFSFGLEEPEMPESFAIERSNMAGDFIENNPLPTLNETPDISGGTSLASDFMNWTSDNLGGFEFAEFEKLGWTDMTDVFKDGYATGEDLLNSIQDLIKLGEFNLENGDDLSSMMEDLLANVPDPELGTGGGGAGGGGSNPTGGKLDSIGEIEEEIDINDEVLKYVKDIANLRYQQNFITLTPEIINNNQFVDATDQEDAVAKLNDDIAEALYSGIDGVIDY